MWRSVLVLLAVTVLTYSETPTPVARQIVNANFNYGKVGNVYYNSTSVIRTLLDTLLQDIYNREATMETNEVLAHHYLLEAMAYENKTLEYLIEMRRRVANISVIGEASSDAWRDANTNVIAAAENRKSAEDKLNNEIQTLPESDPRASDALCIAVNGEPNCTITQTCQNCLVTCTHPTATIPCEACQRVSCMITKEDIPKQQRPKMRKLVPPPPPTEPIAEVQVLLVESPPSAAPTTQANVIVAQVVSETGSPSTQTPAAPTESRAPDVIEVKPVVAQPKLVSPAPEVPVAKQVVQPASASAAPAQKCAEQPQCPLQPVIVVAPPQAPITPNIKIVFKNAPAEPDDEPCEEESAEDSSQTEPEVVRTNNNVIVLNNADCPACASKCGSEVENTIRILLSNNYQAQTSDSTECSICKALNKCTSVSAPATTPEPEIAYIQRSNDEL